VAATHNVARYRELSMLGVGGMARVLLAEDTLLGRQVALKRLPAGADPDGLSRLRREALVGASISHPNVVSIYDVMAGEDGEIVVVMEYVAGETLRQRLDRHGRLSADELLPILSGVAAGLDAIHARGIVHRDVKPANILLGGDDCVKLADLGIASAPDRTRITIAGSVLGSFGYMAPEQLEDGRVTAAIDIYALAAVAFEGLSGRKAHPETNPVAAAHAIATGPPPDLREAWPDAPPATAALLTLAMARDPAARPASAGALVAELRRTLDAAGSPPPVAAVDSDAATEARTAPTRLLIPGAHSAARRVRSTSWLLAPVLLAAVLVAIALALLSGGRGSPRPSRASTPATTPVSTPAPATTPSTPAVTSTPATAPPPPPGPGHPKPHHHHGKHGKPGG